MKKSFMPFFTIALVLMIFSSGPAYSEAGWESFWKKENLQVRVRSVVIAPDDTSTVNTGGTVDADPSDLGFGLDFTYFVTNKIGIGAGISTASHDLFFNGGNTTVGSFRSLPSTVFLQYHPFRGNSFSPYLGAGVHHSIFYGESAGTNFTDFKVDNSSGFALQAGADYWINNHWGINFDVQRHYADVDASVNNNVSTADIDFDPWIFNLGVSFRF